MNGGQAAKIGEHQRRSLAITLALLDEALCQFQEWAEGREMNSVLFEARNGLTPAKRQLILQEIAAMKTRLAGLRDALSLPKRTCSAADDIWSRCAVLREGLMELQGSGLRGYGELHASLKEYLERELPPLLEALDRIAATVAKREASDASGRRRR